MPPSLLQAAREKEAADDRLAERLRTVVGRVDCGPPHSLKSHLSSGSGKAVMQAAARQREIDAGNARMLKNLVAIQAGGASFDVGKQQQPHGGGGSLSRTAKKTEQARVDAENTRLLDRIIADHGASPPERKERWLSRCGKPREYSPSTLAQHFQTHKERVARLSRFPAPR